MVNPSEKSIEPFLRFSGKRPKSKIVLNLSITTITKKFLLFFGFPPSPGFPQVAVLFEAGQDNQ